MESIVSRFAPSPTGLLHVGNARTALFAWLVARHNGGKFVLRIEDTDQERSSQEAVQAILESLKWLGLNWDEGPYYQSRRLHIYKKNLDELLAKGLAYRCTCTEEEIKVKREAARAAGKKYLYDRTCRNKPDPGPDVPHVVRLKVPIEGECIFNDLIKGEVRYPNKELDDHVLTRSDGWPTYNFCVVIDDHDMGITHVIRGDDHLPNTPKQIHLYNAFGYKHPIFAHLPLIWGPDKSPLSKRHCATSVVEYKRLGYMPETMVNFLARLGWGHGDQEEFSIEELIRYFDLKAVSISPSIFNIEKLNWLNGVHIRKATDKRLSELVGSYLEEKGLAIPDEDWLAKLIQSTKDRSKTLLDIADTASYLLADQIDIDPKAENKHLKSESIDILKDAREYFSALNQFDDALIEELLTKLASKHQVKLGKIAQPLRVALTGGEVSPPITDVLRLLGKQKVLARLDAILNRAQI